ncbi:MAG: adenosylcobinamide-GDP ribazoletransferase, partial [Pseudomonadota bacterium]
MIIDESWLKERAGDLTASVLFLTRLRYGPPTPVGGAAIAQAAWAFPIAGLVVGAIGALVILLALRLGLSSWAAAALAVGATMAVTGCLHEDGLADTTDGFGAGKTREQKLAIMRDSRIGTYGVCVLALSILLRVAALASLADSAMVVPALLAAHGAARAIMPAFMFFVPPARRDGLSSSAGRPPRESVIAAAVLGVLILLFCFGPVLGLAALVLLLIGAGLVAWLSLAQIDGQTGDVLGAVE